MKNQSGLQIAVVAIGKLLFKGLRFLFVTPEKKRDEKTYAIIKNRSTKNFFNVND
tara:strand:- start:114 stop:278 length:165 start_codon:yes stop_codon:yes gene_type:complete